MRKHRCKRVCLSVCPSVRLSVRLSVCLSVVAHLLQNRQSGETEIRYGDWDHWRARLPPPTISQFENKNSGSSCFWPFWARYACQMCKKLHVTLEKYYPTAKIIAVKFGRNFKLGNGRFWPFWATQTYLMGQILHMTLKKILSDCKNCRGQFFMKF